MTSPVTQLLRLLHVNSSDVVCISTRTYHRQWSSFRAASSSTASNYLQVDVEWLLKRIKLLTLCLCRMHEHCQQLRILPNEPDSDCWKLNYGYFAWSGTAKCEKAHKVTFVNDGATVYFTPLENLLPVYEHERGVVTPSVTNLFPFAVGLLCTHNGVTDFWLHTLNRFRWTTKNQKHDLALTYSTRITLRSLKVAFRQALSILH
jgi:hypothetical protein